MKRLNILLTIAATTFAAMAQSVEPIPWGDFNRWTTRLIDESVVIGGKQKKIYAVGPEKTVDRRVDRDFKGEWA